MPPVFPQWRKAKCLCSAPPPGVPCRNRVAQQRERTSASLASTRGAWHYLRTAAVDGTLAEMHRSSESAEVRALAFPLNIYAQAIRIETGHLDSLHFGLYRHPDDGLFAAQANATALLLSRLPPPPARVLEVGVGLGATLRRLAALGYTVVGISPDRQQIARLQDVPSRGVSLVQCRFEEVLPPQPGYDVVLFQESAQYITPPSLLIEHSRRMLSPGGALLIMDEFPASAVDPLLEQAETAGLVCREYLDLTQSALPSVRELATLIERHEQRLSGDLDRSSLLEGLVATLQGLVAHGDALEALDAAEIACLERILCCLRQRGLAAYGDAAARASASVLYGALHFIEENRATLLEDAGLAALTVREVAGTLRKRCAEYVRGAWRYCLIDLRCAS